MNSIFDITLLYVEDEESIREELSYFLEKRVKKLYVASDGLEGLQLYKEVNPDIIISDIRMPNLNGIEMCEEIKKINENARIIILTAFNDSENLTNAINLNIDRYLIKPTNLKTLHDSINKIYRTILLERENKEVINLLEQYKKVVDLSSIVSKTDLKGVITYTNKKFEEISGYSKEELIGNNHSIVRHEDVSSELYENLWHTIRDKKQTWFGKIKNKNKNGEVYYVDSVIDPILNSKGEIIEYIGIRHDITDIMNPKKQLLDDIENMNEPMLILSKIDNYNILKEFYTEKERSDFEEEFSKILLVSFPSHLKVNKVYILGSGLFAFLKNEQFNSEHMGIYLNKLLSNLAKTDVFFKGNKYEIDLLLSFSSEKENLFDDAITGVRELIEKRKDKLIFSNGLHEKKQIEAKDKLKVLNLIKYALSNEENVLSFYQPIVCNKSHKIIKYESLLRIVNERDEIISPFFFMEEAKKSGYYHDLTKKVIKNAKKVLSLNKQVEISINLSSFDIEDLEIRDLLFELVSQKSNKGRITFELLEDEKVRDLKTTKIFIELIKAVGHVKISIDDFGSGYSNYERLNIFQPDFIKIDGSLIKDILISKYNESIVKSIIIFARENNIKTIAEFVSDENISKKVKELGVDFSQGYYFGKPEPIIL
ncbi:EAL domain-containing protein [Arcobacter sp. YIC-310]|uniref:EAL domain-containing protein n=1 Tax=Arcobacter sp. YIC-310 TaxID=3376632 RepID=UPI003C29A9DC